MLESVSNVPMINFHSQVESWLESTITASRAVGRLDGEARTSTSTAQMKLQLVPSLAIRQFVNTGDKAYAEVAKTYLHLMLKVSFS